MKSSIKSSFNDTNATVDTASIASAAAEVKVSSNYAADNNVVKAPVAGNVFLVTSNVHAPEDAVFACV